ncbi:SGNH/GDSL hydrolase family protein [Streptomyces sp. SL13]|uniref:SGNH/GDSL hydrolase family protein n=1 Tax=Streptantibioticus silvisoli TaxID=2705255 RepID=A0AA90H245_9ACTN|nr:GDSL-type esterase/lipase family protein [Streptantibioticus silvisoli]MDI5970641.1 SGNH/GDSL hydrolase family protein [Streptantibioticus silvisoli]
MTTWHEVEPAGGPVEVRGALDLERTLAGVLPRRLPAWTRAQYPGPFLDAVTMTPSGVRLAFRTAATAVELRLLTTVSPTSDDSRRPDPGTVDLVVDGELTGSAAAPAGNVLWPDGELEAGEPGAVRFDGLASGAKDVELWLPQDTPCELVALRADAPITAPGPHGRRRWTHYGSSISQGPGADRPTGTWPAVAARAAGVELLNLSLAGNAVLDPFVARTIRDTPADLISVKIGINVVNTATFRRRSFAPAVHGFLDTVRDGHPEVPLLVVSPVSCPAVEHHPGPTGAGPDGTLVALGDPDDVAAGALTLTVIREELAALVRDRAADDPHLHHLDGRALLGPHDTAHLPDGLHPDAAAQHRMGRRFTAEVFAPPGPFAGRD